MVSFLYRLYTEFTSEWDVKAKSAVNSYKYVKIDGPSTAVDYKSVDILMNVASS